MHELSLVRQVMELASEAVKAAGGGSVESIVLEIGELAGVEWDAFLLAWESSRLGTIFQNAGLQIEKVEGKAKCLTCGHEFPARELYALCPACEDFRKEIIRGKEFRIRALTLVEDCSEFAFFSDPTIDRQ